MESNADGHKVPYKKDLKDKVFNRLKVVEYSHMSLNNGAMWSCICECGRKCVVGTSSLTLGYTKSCGCLQREAIKALAKHGMTGTAIYKCWASMKQRCNNPNIVNWEIYGGRGITYDQNWESFDGFYADMGDTFEDGLEIDRIDVNGNYCKENCRWVTHNENNFNKNKQSNNKSGKTGVAWREKQQKWFAYITVNRKQIGLGMFINFDEAVKVRQEAELDYYGYNRE